MRKNKVAAIVIMLCCVTIKLAAQNLPGVQTTSLRAPANIKIDGIASEWNSQFQAYNHATDIFYTISNNDETLFLTVKAAEPNVIYKIMGGGISFIIDDPQKKSDKDGVMINFPAFDKKSRPSFSLRKKGEIPPRPEFADKVADSIKTVNNAKLLKSSKWIMVTGVKGLDTMQSVYNNEGIEAMGLFDNKKAYTCEIAIPLKYLNLSVTGHSKFAYHILLNSGKNKFAGIMMGPATSGTNGDGTPMNREQLDAITARIRSVEDSIYATTDFWGEYTLAAP